ncbi:MAG: 50S ribosomal protein L13 [Candidatus Portnoybacteria bacterium]|nr:50S ribosomal protein L13 [Candidatus Portnoybacteria bacterium]
MKTHKIDAKNKTLGRLAAEIAAILRGKNSPNFAPNKVSEDKVVVFNAKDIVVTGKKFKDKKYYKHSGYLGSLRERTFEEIFEKDEREPLRIAVYGMLPKNKLRDKMIKNLKIYAGEEK